MSRKPTDTPFPDTEAILDALEAAFELEWQEDASESELPDDLRDAVQVMERGRALLEKGLHWSVAPLAQKSEESDAEYRAAARNGKPIPDAMLERMHAEREKAEHEAPDK